MVLAGNLSLELHHGFSWVRLGGGGDFDMTGQLRGAEARIGDPSVSRMGWKQARLEKPTDTEYGE
jgi:hypothetical protein